MEERPTELVAKLTRAQEPLDATANQRAHVKSVFGANFQDVSESGDDLQKAIEVVSARSDADGMALLQTSPRLMPPWIA